ncbi:SORL1 [Branchiostoma lanceolatum]|uniref:SORL1 protein n=1 Tax=Branchiostoma lanceolatum TaxID=7740 RepID=A0A8K0EH64_BRALA|nr:SORL1 [Branchiostoma lanceolatum]
MATGLLLFVCLLSIGHVPLHIAGTEGECFGGFSCESTGACFYSFQHCDGVENCEDGSDERDCWDKYCSNHDYFRCEDGSDEKNCSNTCPRPDDFRCELDGECTPFWSKCDGYNNCQDGTDETDCWNKKCPNADDFRCESSGACVASWSLCNGDEDCPEGSDEDNCWSLDCPNPDDFRCEGSGACVESWDHCNGDNDCPDGSDEDDCWSLDCPNLDDFRCEHNGQCKPPQLQCNGIINCEDGSDENSCWNLECSEPDDFRCESNGMCTSSRFQCDGNEECSDGSDEKYCTAEHCPLPKHFCEYGSCIPDTKRCDGVDDCHDGSDENGCVCTSVEFRCEHSSRCVAPLGVCDGLPDCDDASDEMLCQSCVEKGLWQCDSGKCINNASVCDGDKDCSSGADEENWRAPCNGMQLECDGRCLPKYHACDGREDCANGTDEINCTVGGCSAKQFHCEDGSCLLESQLCDNRTDCSGGEDEDDCGDVPPPGFPLGLASRYIPDVFITASSEYKSEFAPSQARYTPPTTPGNCWVPSSVVDQWLQAYFGKTTDVTGVVISGGGSNWNLGSWVTSFTLAFSMDGTSWAPYENFSNNVQVFQGNRDRYNKVSRPLQTPVTSLYIRLYPTGYVGWVAMVMEVYVTNDENTWLKKDEYVPLGVGLDPDVPAAVPKIPDLHMTASSRRDDAFPWQARLNSGQGQQKGAGWYPDPDLDEDEWLQIKHGQVYEVAGVITQGAYNTDHWVTSYKLAFSVDGRTWTMYTNSTGDGEEVEFQGNLDSHRYARNLLDNPVLALYTRFYPLTFHNRIALRVELLVVDEIDSQFIPCRDDVSPGEYHEVFHESQQCDGTDDCPTGKDEANCDDCAMQCPTQWGDPCIPDNWICDDLEDCLDGRDEQECVQGVPKNCFFTCRNNVTRLPTPQLGDGHRDCSDGEDERPGDVVDALTRRWGSCGYSCVSIYSNASCIPDAFSCDGDADCAAGEDEQGCGNVDGSSTQVSTTPSAGQHNPAVGQGATSRPTHGQEATIGPLDGQEVTRGLTDVHDPREGPTAESTTGQGPFESHTGSRGRQNQAMVWLTVAALGGQILYRLAM